MKICYIILIFLFVPFLSVEAQIGINTQTPFAELEVLSGTLSVGGKAFVISNQDNNEMMQVRNDGYIGLGVPNPLVKLDLRANDLMLENAIGIGYTTLPASVAGAGAMRYNETIRLLEYSDGDNWITLQANPDKAFVLAQNSSGQTFNVRISEAGLAFASGGIQNWTVLYDRTSSFNRSTGYFTAPRTGVYSVTVTAVFPDVIIDASAQFELSIQLAGGGTTLKSVVSFVKAVESAKLTNMNRGLFYLLEGQSVVTTVYASRVGSNIKMSTDPSLNILTIAEM